MTLDQLKIGMQRIIEVKVQEIIATKPENQRYLNYLDMRVVCSIVKSTCIRLFNEVPAKIEATCYLAEAVLDPDKKRKMELIKKAWGTLSGLAGIAAIIGAIGLALGWGAGIIATVTAFFAGSSLLGPLGLLIAGGGLSLIAGYFMFHDDASGLSDKAIRVLNNGVTKALEDYWKEHGSELIGKDL